MCIEKGLLDKQEEEKQSNVPLTYFEKSILKHTEEFSLFIQKVQRYFDCYLNYLYHDVSKYYEGLIIKLDTADAEQWKDDSFHININMLRKSISDQLCQEKINHYELKYTNFLAVKKFT